MARTALTGLRNCLSPATVSDRICAATNASEHAVQVCYQEHLGMAPVRYLSLRRMRMARRARLLENEGGATVTSIAMARGISVGLPELPR